MYGPLKDYSIAYHQIEYLHRMVELESVGKVKGKNKFEPLPSFSKLFPNIALAAYLGELPENKPRNVAATLVKGFAGATDRAKKMIKDGDSNG